MPLISCVKVNFTVWWQWKRPMVKL